MPPALKIMPKGKTVKFERQLSKMDKLFAKGISRGAYLAGNTVVGETQKMLSTGMRTGIHYPGNPHRSSAPGEPPRSQSGQLVASAYYAVRGSNELRVGEKAPYAERLEFGDFVVEPRPHLIIAISRRERDVEEYLRNGPLNELKRVVA